MSVDLPVAEIRAAVAAGEWEAAHALLERHEQALRDSFDPDSGAGMRSREALLELLAAQRSLIDELRGARDEAGRTLERMGRDRRGMAAYLQDGQ